MLCYKDKTFCPYWEECKKGNNCHRAYTDEVKKNASETELLVCLFNAKPLCFISNDNKKHKKDKD